MKIFRCFVELKKNMEMIVNEKAEQKERNENEGWFVLINSNTWSLCKLQCINA